MIRVNMICSRYTWNQCKGTGEIFYIEKVSYPFIPLVCGPFVTFTQSLYTPSKLNNALAVESLPYLHLLYTIKILIASIWTYCSISYWFMYCIYTPIFRCHSATRFCVYKTVPVPIVPTDVNMLLKLFKQVFRIFAQYIIIQQSKLH